MSVGSAAIVETGTLLKVILYSLAGGVGVSVVVGAGIASVGSLVDAVRQHRTVAGAAWAVASAVCLGIAVAAVALGIVVMVAK